MVPSYGAPAVTPEVPPLNGSSPHVRLSFIDAARGATMLFVLVSHFGATYFDSTDVRGRTLETMTLIASPTFMLVSGLLVGFLYRSRPANFPRLRLALLDRGMFLLTIGHVILLAGTWSLQHTARCVFITDAIGVSMIVGPILVTSLTRRVRLSLAATLYGVSWIVATTLHPGSASAALVAQSLFGAVNAPAMSMIFPIVPWCCLDIAATALGEGLGARFVDGDAAAMTRLLARSGAAAVVTALVLKATYLASVVHGGPAVAAAHGVSVLKLLTSAGAKFPPSPAYFLFYGGLGLLWVAGWSLAERRGAFRGTMKAAAALGQTSLFVFLLQFFVYFTLLHVLRPYLPIPGAWPAYLLASIAVILALARVWHRSGYRRFMTVGLRSVGRTGAVATSDVRLYRVGAEAGT